MNKNWLYRVLALALVAMLALPMFALAEDVLPEQVEEAAEEGELTFGEDETVAKDRYESSDGSIMINLAYSDPSDEFTLTAGARIQILVEGVGYTNKVTFKSSNKKVAQVNSEGVLTAIDVGKAKITVSGKTSTGKKLKNSFHVKVEDKYRPAGVAAVFDGSNKTSKPNAVATNDGFPFSTAKSFSGETYNDTLWTNAVKANDGNYNGDLGVSGLILGGDKIHVLPGEGWKHYYDSQSKNLIAGQLYFDMMAYNADDLYLDGLDDPSDYTTAPLAVEQFVYNRDYNWKITSGKDVVFVDNVRLGGKKTSDIYLPQQYQFEAAPHMIFFKPGKATLKVTTSAFEGNRTNSTNFNFVVDKNERTFYKPTEKDLKTAIANDTLYYGVQSVKINDMGNVDVTLFFVNGTDFSVTTLKDFEFGLSTGLLPSANNTEYPDYTDVTTKYMDDNSVPFVGTLTKRTVKAAIKRHKTTTVKLTFKSTYAWYKDQKNSYQLKTSVKNEVYEPFQMLNNPRFYYYIDCLKFKLSAGFYNVQTFNPTTGKIKTPESNGKNIFVG